MPKGYKKNGSFAGKIFKKNHKINLGRKRIPFSKKWKIKISKGIKKRWQNKNFKEKMRKILQNRVGIKNPNWKGGIKKQAGYIAIYKPKHPFCSKAGYVFQHRLIIEKYIKRYLLSKEKVHHLSRKDDNRLKMLMVFTNANVHRRFHKGYKVKPEEIIFDGRKLNHS